MPEDDMSTIWDRVREHGEKIQHLDVQQQLNTRLLEQHAQEFREMNKGVSQQHGETLSRISDLSADVRVALSDMDQRKGASHLLKVYLPILISAGALLFVYLQYVE